MAYRCKRLKAFKNIIAFILLGILLWSTGVFRVMASVVDCDKFIEIIYQGRHESKEHEKSDTKYFNNAVPQSMAGNGNTIYLLKRRASTNTSIVEDRSYIMKILDANTSNPKLVLPADAAYVGHGNGMTYYNGYLYVADGDNPKLYRIEEEAQSTNETKPFSTKWSDQGTLYYEKKTMSVQGINSGETIKNIAHYSGNYFIVCLKSSYSGTTNTLTYGVGLLNGTTFTIQKRFTVIEENTYKAVQDIDYNNGYLWVVLYDNMVTEKNNHIHLVEVPTSYSEIVNGATYEVKKTVEINENEAGRSKTNNEIESVYVYGSNFYTWSNIRDTRASGEQLYGWSETFCRYPRFPDGVPVTSVTTKSETSLEVKWNTVSYANQYRIDRRIEGGEFSTIATLDSSKTSYTDTGLTAGTKYYYRVYGKNSAGTSPKRGGVFGVTKTTIPKVSSVTAISESELKVKWNAVTGAKKYIVCRKRENTGEGWQYYSRIKETTSTEYTDTGLEPNTLYYYGIIAVNETGAESGGTNGNPGDNKMSGRTLEAIQVALNNTTLDLTTGEPYQLTATVTPAYAADSTVSWTSSDSTVVSVDQDGKLKALKPGTAVITAAEQMKNKTASCSVTVNEPDLVLPADLIEIKESAFEGTDAKTVYIHDNCNRIGPYAFRNSGVTKIRIPAECEIGEEVFSGCEDVIVFGTAGSNAQEYCEENDNLTFIEE